MNSSITVGSDSRAGAPPNKWLVALSVTFGTLMGTIDGSVVNIALPHIRGNLGASIQEIAWIVTAYTTTNVCIMPLTGFLGRRFGQKRVYMIALCVFLVSSLLCGMTESLTVLVVLRAFQGAGAGALLPTEQAILQRSFPPSEQGMAMAVFSMTVMLGPALGPTLGGIIVDHLSWPWIFYVNLPVGLAGLLMVARFVHVAEERDTESGSSIDWSGILLLLVSLTALQLLLAKGDEWGWTEPGTQVLALGVCFGLVSFAYRELVARKPAVRVEIFREPVFMVGTVLAGVLYAMLTANVLLVPLFMQEALGITATAAGMALLPRVAVSAVVSPLLGRFYGVLPPQLVLAVGALCFGVTCLQMGFLSLDVSAGSIALIVAIQGIGFSGINVTLNALALSRIPANQKVDASGLHALVRQTSGSLGVAFFAAMLTRESLVAESALAPNIALGRPEVSQHLALLERGLVEQGAPLGAAGGAALGQLHALVQRHALMLAFNKVFLVVGALFLVAIPLCFLLRQKPPETAR